MANDGSRTAMPPELLYLLHGDPTELAEALAGMRAADVAEALRELGPDAGAKVTAALPFDLAVQVFDEPELDRYRAPIVKCMPPQAAAALAEAMSADQRADLIQPSGATLSPAQQVPGGKILLNAAAFGKPGANAIGTSGRNAFPGPGLMSADLSIARRFPVRKLGEAGRVTLRADFYNVLNHANRDNPVSDINRSDFGRVVAFSSSPRIIQLGLKVSF